MLRLISSASDIVLPRGSNFRLPASSGHHKSARDAHTLAAYIVNAVRAGHMTKAHEAVALMLKLQPDFRAAHVQEAFPVRSSEVRDRMMAALQEAGLPG
jgi:hypothetical protein